MEFTKGKVIYVFICQIPIVLILCLIAALLAGPIDWVNYGINVGVGYVLCVLIGLFIPFGTISKWFAKVCKVNSENYNIKYRLLSIFVVSTIYYLLITISLSTLNYFIIEGSTVISTLKNIGIGFLPIYSTAYVSSLLCDEMAFRIANLCDPSFVR